MLKVNLNSFDDLECSGKKDSLSFKGHVFKESGNVMAKHELKEALNNLKYENDIISFLKSLNGFFSIIVENERYVIASVDRVRSTPLFYFINNENIYISDKAHWINSQISFRDIDELGEIEFLLTGYTTENRTLFKDIKQLQPGEFLLIDKETNLVKVSNYFTFEHIPLENKSIDELVQELDEITLAAFKRLIRMLNGRTAIIPLSGGQDSRLIATMFKRLKYQDVICFSYGSESDEEAKISKEIAREFGYPWYFVEYNPTKWREIRKDGLFDEYIRNSGNYSSLPHIQDFLAVAELKNKEIIPDDAVFIPGHAGDFTAGSHIPDFLDKSREPTLTELSNYIFKVHYSLWPTSKNNSRKMKESILESLKVNNQLHQSNILTREEWANHLEKWVWRERQSKFICNSVRVYDFFGYTWSLPLWDKDLIEFWLNIPFELRLKRRLYFEYTKIHVYPYLDVLGDNLLEKEKDNFRIKDYAGIKSVKKSPLLIPVKYLYHLFASFQHVSKNRFSFYSLYSRKDKGKYIVSGGGNINSLIAKEYLNVYKDL